MDTPSLPQTATKIWVPLIVNGGPILATLTGMQWLNFTPEEALQIVSVGWILSQFVSSLVSYCVKNYLKRPVEIITPGMQPNILVQAGTPWWHTYVRYGAIVIGIGLFAMLIYMVF